MKMSEKIRKVEDSPRSVIKVGASIPSSSSSVQSVSFLLHYIHIMKSYCIEKFDIHVLRTKFREFPNILCLDFNVSQNYKKDNIIIYDSFKVKIIYLVGFNQIIIKLFCYSKYSSNQRSKVKISKLS